MKVKTTERGWAGHFIASAYCRFRRNTLIEYGKKKIVVSTVGNYIHRPLTTEPKEIGFNRYYETMAFKTKKVHLSGGICYDADVTSQVFFDSEWQYPNAEDELLANKGHDKVVKEIADKLERKEL